MKLDEEKFSYAAASVLGAVHQAAAMKAVIS